jgi:hypothetical protein
MSTNEQVANTVFIDDKEYAYSDLSEGAQYAYRQLISLRDQIMDAAMKRDQLVAAQSVFEGELRKALDPEEVEG